MARWSTILAMAVATAFSLPLIAQDRAAVDARYQWNLGEIYASEDAWEKAGAKTRAGKVALFDFWQLGADEFLKFIDE